MKGAIKAVLTAVVGAIGGTRAGGRLFEQVLHSAMKRTQSVRYRDAEMLFTVPNALNRFRVETFATKEPETLEWIDGIPDGAVVWDVGANIGLYSCHAAKAKGCRVFAFEPSVFNLELLARNVFLNRLSKSVTIVPLPLCEGLSQSTLNMTSTEWGGALSTFGQNYGWDGKAMSQVFEFATVGLSADEAVERLGITAPDYIKLDVDGIEHLVLRGARAVLGSVRGVIIEVNDGFLEQADECRELLTRAGLTLKDKRRSATFESSDSFGGGKVWNQIWERTPAQ